VASGVGGVALAFILLTRPNSAWSNQQSGRVGPGISAAPNSSFWLHTILYQTTVEASNAIGASTSVARGDLGGL